MRPHLKPSQRPLSSLNVDQTPPAADHVLTLGASRTCPGWRGLGEVGEQAVEQVTQEAVSLQRRLLAGLLGRGLLADGKEMKKQINV